ncbi:MAG: ABC transporter ATP-binding protein [Legionellales bacterium]|nr:ABC transporter ATP-binding protein [Legionellales bacterium]|tara:strand:+ start:6314 stop:8314 length:2001 start_codon:yes stop_codon:yes gene_type:complete
MADKPLLQVQDLSVAINTSDGYRDLLDKLNFSIDPGETFALVGESGCGKTFTSLAITQLLPPVAKLRCYSKILLNGTDLLTLSDVAMSEVRGRRIAMIFQEPMTSLNPVMTVGQQILEVLYRHFSHDRGAAKRRAIELLDAVGIPAAKQRFNEYPHQLSGGMKQRVMIAISLAGEPELLIADEPTTAVDVTIQAQILRQLKDLQQDMGMAILLISHDLGVIAQAADRVGVMYAGQIIEHAPVAEFIQAPAHPYTQGLFAAIPDLAKRESLLQTIEGNVPPLLAGIQGCRFANRCQHAWNTCRSEVPQLYQVSSHHEAACFLYSDNTGKPDNPQPSTQTALHPVASPSDEILLKSLDVRVYFPVRKGILKRKVADIKAVDGVSLELKAGRTLALVGESGCGKSTLGKALLRLLPTSDGEVVFKGDSIETMSRKALRHLRHELQIIFQDPYASLDPRMVAKDIILEGLRHRRHAIDDLDAHARELVQHVGLTEAMLYSYPHEFSGGQRQRLSVARALAMQPDVIICDEPTSALDLSVQAQILNLLKSLQREMGLAYLFISHDISVVGYMADDIAVMYLGRIVEQGPVQAILDKPKHPYTQALLQAVPEIRLDKSITEAALVGEQPSPMAPPSGCHFHPRCPKAMDKCKQAYPRETGAAHKVRCYLHEE